MTPLKEAVNPEDGIRAFAAAFALVLSPPAPRLAPGDNLYPDEEAIPYDDWD